MSDKDIRTWHYGLVARWWSEFDEGGVDVEFFQNVVERCGEPALDAGCGTGRLLIPCLRSGRDVDGTDVSSDMLDWCALAAAAEGLKANLYEQAMHKLDLPRRYRTIFLCGSFGLGGTRATDLVGLRRIHSHLEPGGTLLMDHHLPRSDWDHGHASAGDLQLPAPWPDLGIRRRTSTGTELELKARLFAVDPLERAITREISIREFADGTEVAHETGSIVICGYSTAEVGTALESAGFRHVEVVEGPEAIDRKEKRVFFEARA
jgi:SAM-dependent methyltransferase